MTDSELSADILNEPAINKKRIRWAVSLTYFSMGICFSSWASRIPDIKTALELNDAMFDAAGNHLDGEWTNPTSATQGAGASSWPSGNGVSGTRPDPAKAVRWYAEAARQGAPGAGERLRALTVDPAARP